MKERFQLSRRAVLWLGLIAITAFMLYFQDARYNNIDKNGIDYHLLEIKKNCTINKICRLRKFAEGVDLSVQVSQQGQAYMMTVSQASDITRVVMRIETVDSPQIEKGVVSSEVKGREFVQTKLNLWQLKNILLKQDQVKFKYILYVFTENAIYEIRQTTSLSK